MIQMKPVIISNLSILDVQYIVLLLMESLHVYCISWSNPCAN